jgi:transposase
MLSLGSSHTYYLYYAACDMRKSFNSLSGLVVNELGRNPASGEVFVFVNRRRNCIKLLHWERGGFVLYYKRLEQGVFTLPKPFAFDNSHSGRALSWPELVLMIESIQVQQIQQKLRYQLP